MATSAARQTPPGARPNREARGACRPHHVAHMRLPGRSLELRGDAHPRGMTVPDRTRLTGRLFFCASAAFQRGLKKAPAENRPAGAPESERSRRYRRNSKKIAIFSSCTRFQLSLLTG